MKKIAISQSNYIPWKGYFDLINMVDEFVLFDDVQYTKRDWRNRNRIKTPIGSMWLTLPVEVKGKFFQSIKDTKISDVNWGRSHWASIVHNYSKALFFKDYKDCFEQIFLGKSSIYLSEVNYTFIKEICNILGIKTKLLWSSELQLIDGQTEKLVSICNQLDATTYLSGPAAKSYFNEDYAISNGIKTEWMDYSNYPEYRQMYPPFDHYVSVLDLIFNEGASSSLYMKSFQRSEK